ncbi:secondary thiamine-phosphate synthase enzyme YjbQ [Acidilobus sp.]|uniref:secondary thiamine-phosphate synthase enzyme YjbQ n=1 Tax=Acidilobus sp. TaxID=1872109 RepID=UPI003D01E008
MKFINETLDVRTRDRFDVIDVTDSVREFLYRNNVTNGLLIISVPHTTAAVTINEAEAGLMDDILTAVKRLFEPGGPWKHNLIDNNAHAHIAASFIGNSRCLTVINGSPKLGRWQRVLLIEMDGPRTRHLELTFIGE